MYHLTKKILLAVGVCAMAGSMTFAYGKEKKTEAKPIFHNYFSVPASDVASPDSEGFIRRWNLLEPIGKPNRGNTVFVDTYIKEAFAKEYFPGQMTIIPEDGEKVKALIEEEVKDPKASADPRSRFSMEPPKLVEKQATLVWHAVDSKLFNVKLIRFADAFDKEHYGGIFWAVTVVNCEEDMPNVRLAVGSNSASQWWVNGESTLVLSNDRRMVQDDGVSKRITLKKGKNIIRGAVINGPGMSDFCVRILDESGKPVKNITISCK